MKNKKIRLLVGGILIVCLLGLAVWMFTISVTPYTQDFYVAKSGERVQVWGKIDKDSIVGNEFDLVDSSGSKLEVFLKGQMPANIDHANSCVVTGVWENGLFKAESILLKCPSKYEDSEEAESGRGL
ncbi:MAG: cytochrome c maturation protein CcmE [Caldisericia bacterium]|nr:cytochrome c maturation protein CcmE [Caldisericia bacterium]